MWKEYSKSYIKYNRSSGITVMVAALIAALFLSLLCSLFYNAWIYEIDRIILEEGDWQGRILGEISEEQLSEIDSVPNVKKVIVNEELSEGRTRVIDLYFDNQRSIYHDMPLITDRLGVEENAATYHELLLSRYLIHDPMDKEPPLLLSFYLFLLMLVSTALILIIRNSFSVSMNARIHQFGILSSIGATPRQIRSVLMQEAIILSAGPFLVGILLGIVFAYGAIQLVNRYAANVSGRLEAVFRYHPLVLIVTSLAAFITILFSAWKPARELSKMTPLEAIKNPGAFLLKRRKHSGIISLLFGMEGELAVNALKAKKKALLTATFSLVLSFLGFTLMLCFFTLSCISTNQTYFTRYQDVWDVMVTLERTNISDVSLMEELREITGIRDVVVYQKGLEQVVVSKELLSDEVNQLGGLGTITGMMPQESTEEYLIKAPIVVLDDESFQNYCNELGIEPRLDGVIVINRIWDNINSDFRHKRYIPFIKKEPTTSLQSSVREMKLPVLAYTQQQLALREEFDASALVHVIPLSLWNEIREGMNTAEAKTYIRVLGKDRTSLEELNLLEKAVVQLVSRQHEYESENRIQEKLSNDELNKGAIAISGAFCILLAMIGIANVFSNTMGFLRQRKGEFAQYMSVGMTPSGMKKMFLVEALVIAGRPLLITLPLTALFVVFAVTASHLELAAFLAVAPIGPIFVFCMTIFGFVGLAYYIGGKRLLKCDLSEVLRNDIVD